MTPLWGRKFRLILTAKETQVVRASICPDFHSVSFVFRAMKSPGSDRGSSILPTETPFRLYAITGTAGSETRITGPVGVAAGAVGVVVARVRRCTK